MKELLDKTKCKHCDLKMHISSSVPIAGQCKLVWPARGKICLDTGTGHIRFRVRAIVRRNMGAANYSKAAVSGSQLFQGLSRARIVSVSGSQLFQGRSRARVHLCHGQARAGVGSVRGAQLCQGAALSGAQLCQGAALSGP